MKMWGDLRPSARRHRKNRRREHVGRAFGPPVRQHPDAFAFEKWRAEGPPYDMRQNFPARRSAIACWISCCVFITNGPYFAIGSRSGRPAISKTRAGAPSAAI